MSTKDKIKIVLGSKKYLDLVPIICELIRPEAQNSLMLNWEPEEINKQVVSGQSLIALKDQEVVGYVGLVIWQKYVEIAALVVKRNQRHQGIGYLLIEASANLAITRINKILIILPNEHSFQIAKLNGFTEVPKASLAAEIWSSCVNCLEYQNFPKCHCRPMIWKPEKTNGFPDSSFHDWNIS
jgi:N-acetylglutamate synthase-like GNAT family acetyltransferase